MTVFAHFPASTKYFGEGAQQVMINFRVDNLDELLAKLADGECPDRSESRRSRVWTIRMDMGSGGQSS